MTRTAAELAVERDRLLESGRTEAEVEAMQLAGSALGRSMLSLLVKAAEASDALGCVAYAESDGDTCATDQKTDFDEMCTCCKATTALKEWRTAVSHFEKPTGQYAPHPPGGAT